MPKKAATADSAKKKTATKSVAAKKKAAPKKTTKKRPAAKTDAAKAEASPKAGAKRLHVRQVRSGIGHAFTYRRTLEALGLKHHQDHVVVADNPSMRGMLQKVRHLVEVTVEEG
jgi:large subunit ribosomal protein L30